MRPALIANLLIALTASPAATAADAAAPSMETTLEYHLAAAARPGDALSDHLLARLMQMHLQDARAPALPPALRARLASEHRRLAAQADSAMMDDPALLSINLGCHGRAPEPDRCDARRARLAQLAGDNAFYAMTLMSAAFSRGDDAGFVQAAATGADADRYDAVFRQAFAALSRRFAAIPDTDVPAMPRVVEGLPIEGVTAMALAAAVAMPAYQAFGEPCRQSEGALAAQCVAIAHRMVASEDATLDVQIGISILEAIGDDRDRALAAERKRELLWLNTQVASRFESAKDLSSLAADRRYFDVMAARGELPAMRAWLADRGVPVQPPADWSPGTAP